jgi:hypothetical protein
MRSDKASPLKKVHIPSPHVVPGAAVNVAVAALASPASPVAAATVVVVHVPQPVVEMDVVDSVPPANSNSTPGDVDVVAAAVASPKKHMSLRQAGKVVQAAVAFGLHASASDESSPALPGAVLQPSPVPVSPVADAPRAVTVPAAAAATATATAAAAAVSVEDVASPVGSPHAATVSMAPMAALSAEQLQARRLTGQAQLDAAKTEWVRLVSCLCECVCVYVCVCLCMSVYLCVPC